MIKKNKILILILSTCDPSYNNFKKAISETWVRTARQNGIRCIFYSGNNIKNELINDELKLCCDDSLKNTGKKLYYALKFIHSSQIEFTHIYRTNLSSFLFINKFENYVNKLDISFYGGYTNYFHKLKILNRYRPISILFSRLLNFQKINYAAGTGFFLSKDLIEKIINFNNIPFHFIDDVMVGEILKIKINDIPRYDFVNDDIINISLLNVELIENCFLIRLKSLNRHNDVSKIYQINKFNSLKDYLTFQHQSSF